MDRQRAAAPSLPILLYNGECGFCRAIAGWVRRSEPAGPPVLEVRPIGHDPQSVEALHPGLTIWNAYKRLHVLMPDGSTKLDGEAVAEVLRRLPSTRWFAWTFAAGVGGIRPFQWLLNAAYFVLADVRPVFGCESCGGGAFWAGPIGWSYRQVRTLLLRIHRPTQSRHFRPLPLKGPGQA